MQLIKHGESVVAIVEHHWEKKYLKTQRASMKWVPLFLAGGTTTFAEIDPVSLQVRMSVGQALRDQQEVVFHVSYHISTTTAIIQLRMEEALRDTVSRLSLSSRRNYVSDAIQFAEWMLEQKLTPSTLTHSHAISYRAYLQEHCAKATEARKLVVARRLMDEMRKQGKISLNPFSDIRGFRLRNETSHMALNEEQAQALLDAIDTSTLLGLRDYVLILLLLRTGMRRSEAAALTLADLTMDQGHFIAIIQHSKGGMRRTVKIPVDVWRVIAAYIEALQARHMQELQRELEVLGEVATPEQRLEREQYHRIAHSDPLFVSFRRGDHPTRQPMGDKAIEVQVKRYSETLSLHLTPHGLRATFITLALENQAKLEQVQYTVGHRDPRTTERYQARKHHLDDNAVDFVKLKRRERGENRNDY
jgi:site-specific recombinase XerD